eukprot:ANDGO_03456.mRNA.1 Transmembrane protein 120 homolog
MGVDEEVAQYRRDTESLSASFHEYLSTLAKCESLESKLAKQLKTHRKALGNVSKSAPPTLFPQTEAEAGKELDVKVGNMLPKPGDYFLRLFFGGSISVIFSSKERKLGFKSEYERFKQKMNYIAMFFCVILLASTETRFLDVLFQLFAVYYYTTLVLRELILRANGTDLKPWWIAHHYVSIAATTFFLTWPDTAAYREFRKTFFVYAFCTALVQVLQTAYQLARLYPRRVLGKSQMETAWGELPLFFSRRGLVFLVPCLLAMYSFQYFLSYALFLQWWVEGAEWQTVALALSFAVAATGNCVTLFLILTRKLLNSRKHVKALLEDPNQRVGSVLESPKLSSDPVASTIRPSSSSSLSSSSSGQIVSSSS